MDYLAKTMTVAMASALSVLSVGCGCGAATHSGVDAGDTGVADTGADTAMFDAGVDTGVADTGTLDTGTLDTGTLDTGTLDTGMDAAVPMGIDFWATGSLDDSITLDPDGTAEVLNSVPSLGTDAYVARFIDGRLAWAARMTGPATENVDIHAYVDPLPDGGAIVAFRYLDAPTTTRGVVLFDGDGTESTLTPELLGESRAFTFVARIDDDGVWQWVEPFGFDGNPRTAGTANDYRMHVNDVRASGAGEVLVIGSGRIGERAGPGVPNALFGTFTRAASTVVTTFNYVARLATVDGEVLALEVDGNIEAANSLEAQHLACSAPNGSGVFHTAGFYTARGDGASVSDSAPFRVDDEGPVLDLPGTQTTMKSNAYVTRRATDLGDAAHSVRLGEPLPTSSAPATQRAEAAVTLSGGGAIWAGVAASRGPDAAVFQRYGAPLAATLEFDTATTAFFVQHIDADGAPLWTARIDTNGTVSNPRGIAGVVTNSDESVVYVAVAYGQGSVDDYISFGAEAEDHVTPTAPGTMSPTVFGTGVRNAYLAAYDAGNGTLLWASAVASFDTPESSAVEGLSLERAADDTLLLGLSAVAWFETVTLLPQGSGPLELELPVSRHSELVVELDGDGGVLASLWLNGSPTGPGHQLRSLRSL